MGSVLVVVGPVRGENLVGLAAQQEVEFLLEDAIELIAKLFTEIGHHPAAELEARGRIFPRPAGRLHDAIHGNLGADYNLPHGSFSLFVAIRTRKRGAGVNLHCRPELSPELLPRHADAAATRGGAARPAIRSKEYCT